MTLKWDNWWMVFALLKKEGEYDTIATCTAVCKSWRDIGWMHLPRSAMFSSDEEVAHIKVAYEHRECWRGPLHVHVRGQDGKGRGSIAHLGTFAARFGGTWTHTVELTISAANWHRQDLDSDIIFHNLSRFHSISGLTLSDVSFSSILSFCRLVCNLPGLKRLSLTDIALSGQGACDYKTISDFRLLPSTNVEELVLDISPTVQPFPLLEILDFFAVVALSHRTSAAKHIVPAALFWGKVQSLDIKSMGDRFDISENTQLVHLAFTSAVDTEHVLGLCNSLHDMLSSVTSARISKIEIDFAFDVITYSAAVERLCEGEDGLARIDVILSTPVFEALLQLQSATRGVDITYLACAICAASSCHGLTLYGQSRPLPRARDWDKSTKHASSSMAQLPPAFKSPPALHFPQSIRPALASSGPPPLPSPLAPSAGPSSLPPPPSLDVGPKKQALSYVPLEDRMKARLPKMHRRGILLSFDYTAFVNGLLSIFGSQVVIFNRRRLRLEITRVWAPNEKGGTSRCKSNVLGEKEGDRAAAGETNDEVREKGIPVLVLCVCVVYQDAAQRAARARPVGRPR
ncbi:predicted protein [Postia placenta Mad-698-R]|nr:predicted protein [Postia placenta Mad-698-R]